MYLISKTTLNFYGIKMKKVLVIAIALFHSIFAQSGATDIQELLENYPQIQTYRNNSPYYTATNQQPTETFDFTDYTDQELLTLDSLGVLWFLLDTTLVEEEIPYFGYEYFNNPDKIAVFDNIPIPNNYVLGPGDQLIITIWGSTQIKSNHMINRDGNIFVDGIGQVNLSGLDLKTAEAMLLDRFSEVYSTLKGENPSTFLNLSLGQLKSINISFVGEVGSPGLHAVHPFSDISMALLQVGGVDTVGSLRNIQIIRNGKSHLNFDFYEYLVNGKVSQNIRLVSSDVILVPPRKSYVEIIGEVNRPGTYEAKDTDSVFDMINYAGGITAKAQPKLELYRLKPIIERISEDNAYDVYYSNLTDVQNEPADNITKIRVLSVPDVVREVTIFGQVKIPGNYAYEDSMRVLDLLKIAGGLEDQTFRESIYTKEAEIIRQVSNSFYPKRFSINLESLMNGKTDHNIFLKNKDIIIVRENSKYTHPKYVVLNGEVEIPGKYTIQKKEETLQNIIDRAGGFSPNAYVKGLQMYRDSIQVVLRGYDIFVADGDSVHIPQAPGTVRVEGEVNRQGLVQFVHGKSLSYYIEKAGGYSNNANKKNVIVQYANGNVRKKKSIIPLLFYYPPPVKDGATVTVYPKQITTQFNVVQFLSATASAATSIVTLYLLYENNRDR